MSLRWGCSGDGNSLFSNRSPEWVWAAFVGWLSNRVSNPKLLAWDSSYPKGNKAHYKLRHWVLSTCTVLCCSYVLCLKQLQCRSLKPTLCASLRHSAPRVGTWWRCEAWPHGCLSLPTLTWKKQRIATHQFFIGLHLWNLWISLSETASAAHSSNSSLLPGFFFFTPQSKWILYNNAGNAQRQPLRELLSTGCCVLQGSADLMWHICLPFHKS